MEDYRNGEDGVEQSWTFAEQPAGGGDVIVRVAVAGLAYTGATDSGLHFASGGELGFRYGHGLWIDATGNETHVPARFRGDAIELAVPGAIVDASVYPAVLDPTISPELDTDRPVPRPAGNAPGRPFVASNGADYLVVWQTAPGGGEILGTRIDGTGTVLDVGGIVIAPAGSRSNPGVASNGTDYMVVWQDSTSFGDVLGARVAADGTVLDPAGFGIATGAARESFPAVASNGSGYLVAWQDARGGAGDDVYCARVSSAGAVLDAGGIAVSTAPDQQQAPRIASDGADYLVVWEDRRSVASADVYAARVTGAGAVLDASGIGVSTGAADETAPCVASNGTEYFVAWQDPRGGYDDIFGSRVSSAGVVLDSGGIIVSAAAYDQAAPSVASDGSGYLVVWQDFRSGSSYDIYCGRVSGSGAVLDPAGLALSSAADVQSLPTAGSNGTDYFLAWKDARSGGNIYGRRVDPTGAVDPSTPVISTEANSQGGARVASNGTDYLLVWLDLRAGGADLYAARLSSTGAMLDPSGIVLAPGATDPTAPSVSSNGTDYLVVWTDDRTGSYRVYATRVTGAGVVLDPSSIAVATSPAFQSLPSVASNGADYLIVWQEVRPFTGTDLFGMRVSSAGAPLGPTIAVSTLSDTQRRAQVGSSGLGYLVVYEHIPSTYPAVYGTRVSDVGAVLDPSGFRISTGTRATWPRVASNGSDYLVVWIQSGSRPDDVYGVRVSNSGALLGSGEFAITSEPRPERDASVASDGTDYLVAWYDTRFVMPGIYGTRVQGGVIESPAGTSFGVSASDANYIELAGGTAPGAFLLAYQRAVSDGVARVRARLIQYGGPLGATCASDAACESGFCADGVCCDSACAGGALDCRACSVAAGAPSDGTCAAITGAACSDGMSCTATDTCAAGVCRGASSPCAAGTMCIEGGDTHTCGPCPAGTSSSDGTSCLACAPGTFSMAAGAVSCTAWTDCGAGQYVAVSGTAMNDRVCAACASGTYSTASNASSCTAWSACAAGRYVTAEGTATMDRACAPCAAGTYSSSLNATACAPWTECTADEYQSQAPTSSRDRTCTALTVCAEDQYESAPPTAASDRECAACTTCGPGSVEVSPCSATTDAVCEAMMDSGITADAGRPSDAGQDAAAGLDASSPDGSAGPTVRAGCGCIAPGSGASGGGEPALLGLSALLVALRSRRRRSTSARRRCRDTTE